MPGAIIAIDQDRPGPSTSFGTPGVARNDLWQSRTIRPRSTAGPNISQLWTLLDKPAGSTTVLNNDTATTCDFTPDIPGTYRIQLVTNGGGTGNIQILVARVRYDTSGTLTNRGWVLPAFGELPPEANYPTTPDPGGNTRGWDEVWDFLIADLLVAISSFSPTLLGDVIGTITATEVVALRNLPINTTAPTPGQYLGWDGTHLTYSTVTGFTPSNDLSGTSTSQNVIGWDSHPLDPTTFGTPPDAGIPIWNSSGHWFAITISGDGTISDTGVLAVTKLSSITGPGVLGIDGSHNIVLETSLPLPTEIVLAAAVQDTNNSIPTRKGSRIISLASFPSPLADGRTLHASFVANFETTAGTASVQLQNITDNETVTGTLQTTASTASTEVTVSLVIGGSSGNLKTGKLYEVQLFLTGGSSIDRATLTNARIVLSYS